MPGGLLRVTLEACNVDVTLWPLVAGVVASSAVGGDEIRLDRQDEIEELLLYCSVLLDLVLRACNKESNA